MSDKIDKIAEKLDNQEDRQGTRKILDAINRQYLYYVIIGIFTFIVLVFMPMLGSSIDGGLKLPQGKGAWVMFVITRVFIAVTNIIIFYSFMQQAKLNVRNNKEYIEANKILLRVKNKRERKPMSPKKWEASQYLKKGTTLAIGTVFALFSLSQAILTYKYTDLISYVLLIFLATVFGIFQMKKAEIYWTTEYYRYAKMIEEENKPAEEIKPVEEIKKINDTEVINDNLQ